MKRVLEALLRLHYGVPKNIKRALLLDARAVHVERHRSGDGKDRAHFFSSLLDIEDFGAFVIFLMFAGEANPRTLSPNAP